MNGLTGRRYLFASLLVFLVALAASVPTTADFGLTWDEPAYRYSQEMSGQWWERLARARSWDDLRALLDSQTLLYYWPYGRYGINFHPPLAGQLDLLTYKLFGSWMADIPARRMASVIEFALTVTMLFGFLARRYGPWVGGVAAGSLLLMPRLYGQAHLAETDTPGLLLWTATAFAFWIGLHDAKARKWRVAVGVLLGLAFVEKMGAVMVVVPLLAWLLAGHVPQTVVSRDGRDDWVDGILTTGAMLLPLGLTFFEIDRLAHEFLLIQRKLGYLGAEISPSNTDLFRDNPATLVPGAILAAPFLVWLFRRLLSRIYHNHPVWGVERPALEIWTGMLAFAPVVGWLGNPAWWRETLPRMAHYYAISTARRGVLPDIQVLYWGQTYEYSLPWHNAWTLIGITVPASILVASIIGLVLCIPRFSIDRVPLFFFVNFVTLPIIRMLPTPAHDGVRLFLPTFLFLAAFAGWGTIGLANLLSRGSRLFAPLFRCALTGLVLGPAASQLVAIHPFELSYYNELIGGPRGAWKAGFELSYWYDAIDAQALAELNEKLPRNAELMFSNDLSAPVMVIQDLQNLGKLRSDLRSGTEKLKMFPYEWILTQDSKASAFSRLLFAMRPFYERRPRQLGRLRVLTVASPVAVSRAWGVKWLLDAPDDSPLPPPASPRWIREILPPLGRFWGDGVTKVRKLTIRNEVLEWARKDPAGFNAAAAGLRQWHPPTDPSQEISRRLLDRLGDRDFANLVKQQRQRIDESLQGLLPGSRRLLELIMHPREREPISARKLFERQKNAVHDIQVLLTVRPEAVTEAAHILTARPDAVRTVMTRYPYTDPGAIGGDLDRDLP
jgi:hypothetical protein